MVFKLIEKFTNFNYKSEYLNEEQFSFGLAVNLENHHQKEVTSQVAKIGLLNKNITNLLSIEQEVYYAEVDLELLLSMIDIEFNVNEISKFPEVRRDLSLVLDSSVTFEKIKAIINLKEFSGILKDINIFDYYVGEKIEKDKKAYALSFILQNKTKTLTDKEIDRIMNRLRKKFEIELGAVIRQ